MNRCAVYPKLTQHCKSTRLQQKKGRTEGRKKKTGFPSCLTSLRKKLIKQVRNWSRKEKISFSLTILRPGQWHKKTLVWGGGEQAHRR